MAMSIFLQLWERMYEKAIKLLLTLDEATIDDFYDRFEELVTSTRNLSVRDFTKTFG